MSDDDGFFSMTDELIEQYLLFLRGRGAEPDTSMLSSDHRAKVTEQFEILAALADRHPDLPQFDEDPVAVRLGIVGNRSSGGTQAGDAGASHHNDEASADPVKSSLGELAAQFHDEITVDFAPPWASELLPGLQPVAQCTVLGEIVAVFVSAVDEWSQEPENVAGFFRQHPDVTAVGLVSVDAEWAVVVSPADSNCSIDPVRGWLMPGSSCSPEPVSMALGRHFERCLPQWERAVDHDELVGLGDLNADASAVSTEVIAKALQARPRLPHKREALLALGALDPSALAGIVVKIQSGHLATDEVIDQLVRLGEAAAP